MATATGVLAMSVIQLRGVHVLSPQNRLLLDNVTLDIPSGCFHSICGANGSGKTTLLRSICGLQKTSSGQVLINGQDLQKLTLKERSRWMAWVSAEHPMNFAYTAREVVAWGRWNRHGGILTASDKRAVANALDAMQIQHLADRPITELSLGEQKRVHIARGIASEAKILIMDEPCAPLDAGVALDIMTWIQKATQVHGQTVVASVHDLAIAFNYANIVTLLNRGQVLAEGPPALALSDSHLIASLGVRCHQAPHRDGKLILLTRENL